MPRRVHDPFVIRPPDDLLDRDPDLGRRAADLARAYRAQSASFDDTARSAREEGTAHALTVVSDAGLEATGRNLWAALVEADSTLPERFAAARAAAGTYVLPLIVGSAVPAVQRLPWETLYHPDFGRLGRDARFTLSRRVPGPAPDHAPDRGPLRVALFTCLPDDVDPERGRLDVEEAQARWLQALGPAAADGLARLTMPDDGRFSTFEALIRDEDPHVVLLFAHGVFRDAPGQGEPSHARVQFERDDGRSDFVRGERLAAAFGGSGVRAVVLAACESGRGDSVALAAGLAGQLNAAGIPHVLGMRESVLERAGIAFSAAFAADAVARERVDVAVQTGRAAIIRPLAEALGPGDAATAELSLGQWPLPVLVSHNPAAPLIDWDFEPRPPEATVNRDSLGAVLLPGRFIGRRTELRDWKAPVLGGAKPVLLISGPGGQGKTALAGNIAGDWATAGGALAVWSAREGGSAWDTFWLEQVREAGEATVAAATAGIADERARADALLRLLLRRHGGRLLVFLDNLETLQDPRSLEFTDDRVAAFVDAAHALAAAGSGLRLLITTRYRPPGWPEAAHLPLNPVTYGDFLQLAYFNHAPAAFWRRDDDGVAHRPERIYRALNGNARGLGVLAEALAVVGREAEAAFLAELEKAEAGVRVDMALAALVAHLEPEERALLDRLPAYDTPVPDDGVRALALDLPDVDAALDRLLAVGLVERFADHAWQTFAYRVSPLAAGWLAAQPGYELDPAWLSAAAAYQGWLFAHERPTVEQAVILHRALTRAGEQAAADELALRHIIRPLDRAGLYRALLDEWLPPLRESVDDKTRAAGLEWSGTCLLDLGDHETALGYLEQSLAISRAIGDRSGEGTTLNNMATTAYARGDYETALGYLEQSLAISRAIGDRSGEGTTLNNISQIYAARGDYETALGYLEQSLAISRAIGDAAGLCATLFNMGHIYMQNDQPQEAVGAWLAVYRLARRINLAQALQALEGLAGQLGLPGGLAGWEALSQQLPQQPGPDAG